MVAILTRGGRNGRILKHKYFSQRDYLKTLDWLTRQRERLRDCKTYRDCYWWPVSNQEYLTRLQIKPKKIQVKVLDNGRETC